MYHRTPWVTMTQFTAIKSPNRESTPDTYSKCSRDITVIIPNTAVFTSRCPRNSPILPFCLSKQLLFQRVVWLLSSLPHLIGAQAHRNDYTRSHHIDVRTIHKHTQTHSTVRTHMLYDPG